MPVLQCACQPPSMGRMKTVHSAKPGDELFCLTAVEKGLDFKWRRKQINQTLLSQVEDSYPLEQLGEDSALACNCLLQYQMVKGYCLQQHTALEMACLASRTKG